MTDNPLKNISAKISKFEARRMLSEMKFTWGLPNDYYNPCCVGIAVLKEVRFKKILSSHCK